MSSFYDGDLPARYAVPARRYPQFITAFEAKVVEAQKQIEVLRGQEAVYTLVANALEEAKLPNETRLVMYAHLIKVDITALPENACSDFEPLIDAIGKALYAAKLHKDGIPARGQGSYARVLERCWRYLKIGKSASCAVNIEISVPKEGMRDCYFAEIPRVSTSFEYELRFRDGFAKPEIAASPVSGDEIPF